MPFLWTIEANPVRNVLSLLLAAMLLSACATNNSRIDTAVTSCCADSSSRTFSVHAVNVPAFLGPLMVSNFSVAFANLGYQPMESGGELDVELRYEQSNLNRDEARDDFEERIASGDAMRFIARIVIEVRLASSGKLLWSGHVQRLHDVGPGDYMHTGAASAAIFQSFENVLKEYK